MIIPVRCFTCNKVIAHLWEEYQKKVQEAYIEDSKTINRDSNLRQERFIDVNKVGSKTKEGLVLDDLDIKKYCCRRMFECNIDIFEKI